MKRLFHTGTNDNYLNIIVLIVRLTVAALMITQGLPKLNTLLAGGEIHFPDPIGEMEMALLYLAFYLLLLVTGSRKFSVDYLITRKK